MTRPTIIFLNIVIILILFFLFIKPQYASWQALSVELQERKEELKLKQDYFNNLKTLSEALKNYDEQVAKIDSALPEHPSLPSLLNFFQSTAAQNGLVLKDVGKFAVVSNKEKPEIKEMSLEIMTTGSYPQLKTFLADIEKSSRLIEIENLVFSLPKPNENFFTFDLKTKSNSY